MKTIRLLLSIPATLLSILAEIERLNRNIESVKENSSCHMRSGHEPSIRVIFNR